MRTHPVAGLLLLAMFSPRGHAAPGPTPGNPCATTSACSLPNCHDPDALAVQLWCSAPLPDALASARIAVAIERMRRKGGTCAVLAARLSWLGRRGLIRIFEPAAYPGVGAATSAGERRLAWLLVSRDFVTTYYDAAHRSGNIDSRGVPHPETLQGVLAHEADHLGGAGHVDVDGYDTPNTVRCGDVPSMDGD